jgi:hypothetical protein
MIKATKTDANVKRLTELQRKIIALRQAEQDIWAKIVSQIGYALQRHDGFSVPAPVIIGAIIHAIATYKNTPERTGDWHEAGAKFLRKYRSIASKKAPETRTVPQTVTIRESRIENQDDKK